MADMTAESVSHAFLSGWVSRFGTPINITTDQGRQFESNVFGELLRTLGTNRLRTTPYHPQCNGIIERFHRTLKAAILCHDPSNWTDYLPTILLGLRSVHKADLNASPAELVYGTTLRIPGEFFDSKLEMKTQTETVTQLRNLMRNLRPTDTNWHSVKTPFVNKSLSTCTHVFVRNDSVRPSLSHPYEGPYLVISRTPKHFTVEVNRRKVNISIDRLKPAFSDDFNLNRNSTSFSSHPVLLPVSTSTSTSTSSDPVSLPKSTSTKVTRFGRHVKIPQRYR